MDLFLPDLSAFQWNFYSLLGLHACMYLFLHVGLGKNEVADFHLMS